MIRRFGGQRSLFDAAVGPVEALLDEPMRRLDALLDDEALVTIVVQRQAQRWPQSRWRGSPGTPADVALRLLVLKTREGLELRGDGAGGAGKPGLSLGDPDPPGPRAGRSDPAAVVARGRRGGRPCAARAGSRAGHRGHAGAGTPRPAGHDGRRNQHPLPHRLDPAGRWDPGGDTGDAPHRSGHRDPGTAGAQSPAGYPSAGVGDRAGEPTPAPGTPEPDRGVPSVDRPGPRHCPGGPASGARSSASSSRSRKRSTAWSSTTRSMPAARRTRPFCSRRSRATPRCSGVHPGWWQAMRASGRGPIVTPPSRWGSSGSASRPPALLLPPSANGGSAAACDGGPAVKVASAC